ncbi:MAG TPA: GNAT family N-acetyltransferase [Gaiellaceae bacterium]|nr:GNAT family N-acetyltransferase [Gaiellaceae bacterium]
MPAVRDEWSLLAERHGSLFATPEWLLLWWKHFGAGRELLLTVERDAVLPFYVWRERPLRVVRVLGHGPGDELGPFGPGAREALTRWVETERFDVFACQQLPGPDTWLPALPGGVVLNREGSPVLGFEGKTWEELLAAKSRNFREQVGRRRRALERDFDVRFRLFTEADEQALDTFFRLHALRHGGPTVISRTEAFQREFAAVAAEKGWLRLWLLELDGQPAAAWLGFRFAGAECYYQAGRDPAFDRSSVAFVLLAHTIREALEDGATEYRFLRGDEPYKYRFANADPGLESIVVARGVVGKAALGALRLARRLPIRRT